MPREHESLERLTPREGICGLCGQARIIKYHDVETRWDLCLWCVGAVAMADHNLQLAGYGRPKPGRGLRSD